MNRKRVRQAVLCLTLAVLAFGLGACGEDAAPVATPPAPPPAPPPFEPQAVEVALGESGSTVTLMTTQAGGFTLDGEDFTGGDLNAENGNTYTLALADGEWGATFVPVVVEVTLGASGDMLTITMLEDRTYEAGGEALMAGDTRAAMNGNVYSLSMVDGEWMAMYEPELVSVELGTSGATVTLSRAEDNSYTLADGMMVVSVSTAPDGTPMGALAENGNMYSLSLVDGMWMAMFDAPDAIMVALGTSGDSVSIQMEEDRSYSLDGMMIMDGHSAMAGNGNEYTLSMADGEWMASYVPSEQMVTLGMSGTMITLVKAEDHSYWLGDMAIMDGSMTMSDNGNTYSLSMGADGGWTASWVQDDAVVHMLGTSGATISLQRLEDRSWVRVGASGIMSLSADDATGMIMVTAANGNVYHLMLMDGEYGDAMFQAPAPVAVALGASGESVSLQKAEDGSYWHGDMAVSSGTTLMSSDGREYTLTYAAGGWTASFDAPTVMAALGNSGQTATLVKAEDGTYWLGTDLVVDGETTTMASDGRVYRLSMGEDGMWMGTYVPATQTFAAGMSGIDITAVQDEAGQWSFTNPLTGEAVALASGMSYTVGTRTYMANMDEDGMWSATYVAQEVMVALGNSGEMVTLVIAEDGTYWLGADLAVSGETMATSAVGVSYTLSQGEDGMWTAAAMGNEAMVTLGISGMATLVLAEDGTWWHGSDQVADGSEVAAANGNMYRISMGEDGTWMATYVAAEMEVMGTGLVAMANEAPGTGYTVDGASLPASGNGNITTMDGAMYRVHMEDGMLHGARYDTLRDDAEHELKLANQANFNPVNPPTLKEDDRHTDANEAGTMLLLGTNDEEYSIGDLLGSGMASVSGDNIVAEALAEVTKLQARALAYHALEEQLGDDTAHTDDIVALWAHDTNPDAQTYVDNIFGFQTDGTTSAVALAAETDPDDVIDLLGQLVTALSSADAFAAATEEDGDGVLEAAMLTAAEAATQFSQNEFESTAYLRSTENTRYGLFVKQVRTYVGQDLMFADAADTTNDMGEYDVFAYGLIPDTHTRSDLPARGSLHYRGGTLAVDPQADDGPVLYEGQIDIEVNLTRAMITGLISELQDMDGNPFYLEFQEVASISLPAATSINQGLRWTASGNAQVYYRLIPGATAAAATAGSQFNGDLIGTGGKVAAAAVGVWRLGGDDTTNAPVLLGSYGAEQIDVPDRPAPPLPGLTAAEALDLPDGAEVTVGTDTVTQSAEITDDGELKVVIAVAPNTDPTVDTNDDPLAPAENSITHLVPLGGLTVGGQKTYNNGGTYVGELLDTIDAQRKVINGWIELDATTDNEAVANSARAGRRTAWTTIRNALLTGIFGVAAADPPTLTDGTTPDPTNVLTAMAVNYPGTTGDDAGTPDDDDANDFLDSLVAAFSSADNLAEAREAGGIFDDAPATGTDPDTRDSAWFQRPNGDPATNAAVLGQQPQQLVVGFETTDYTRFGFWRLAKAPKAVNGAYDAAAATDVPGDVNGPTGFAYSPLKPAAYIPNLATPTTTADPSFPSGTAHYHGSTIAVQNTTRFYGDVQLSVTWNAAVASSAVQLAIRGLTDTNGLSPRNATNRVRDITFTGITLTGWTEANNWVPQFDTTGTASTVTYVDLTSGTGPTGNLSGLFVGKGPDGPRAVIGTWTILGGGISRTHHNNGNAVDTANPMVGGYGAELGAP